MEPGILATRGLLDSHLGVRDRAALAGGAQGLPVPGRARDAVVEAELGQDGPQVLDVPKRSESLAAARAVRALLLLAALVVEADADLRGPHEDVEELSEREVEKARDDRDRVEQGE